jgi:hypothetical protein
MKLQFILCLKLVCDDRPVQADRSQRVGGRGDREGHREEAEVLGREQARERYRAEEANELSKE